MDVSNVYIIYVVQTVTSGSCCIRPGMLGISYPLISMCHIMLHGNFVSDAFSNLHVCAVQPGVSCRLALHILSIIVHGISSW